MEAIKQMEEKFTLKARQVIEQSEMIAAELQHSYIGTEHILLGLLSVEDTTAALILKKYKVDKNKVMEMIDSLVAPVKSVAVCDRELFTPRAQNVLNKSVLYAEKTNEKLAGTEHILLALIREREGVATRLLNTLSINLKGIYTAIFETIGYDVRQFESAVSSQEGGTSGSQQGQSGRPGTKSALNQFSVDLTANVREGKTDPVIGRNHEISRIIQILSRRTKNNPCLVGEPGVGKTAIVEAIAARIAAGEVPDSIKNKRLLTLDLPAMVAGSKYRGEFEERIKRVISEVKTDGNILLFLDEIHTIIGAGGAEGSIDAANILKPALARGELQLIGATTLNEYRKYFEKDAALERRFQPVTVEEPTKEETVEILQGIKQKYEEYHKVRITEEAIEAAVSMSARYINDRFLPDKAIDVLDEAASKVKLNLPVKETKETELKNEIQRLEDSKVEAIRNLNFKLVSEYKEEQDQFRKKLEQLQSAKAKKLTDKNREPAVEENDIADVIALWTKIPVAKITEKESVKLKKLNRILTKRVIGQKEAVDAVSNAIRRGRVGLKDPKRPIGSFLFLGPTGVGKTELSKALAEAVFGSENSIIRVDMSEYMEKHSVSKLIGSPPGYVGYDDGGQLSERVRRNPYSVILFDEIEKAHPDVFNILLQVLDEGHITDNTGRKVDFKNTVIIMTSNAGAQRIVEPKMLGFNSSSDETVNYEKMKTGVMEEIKQIFKPEFLNRIDEIIVFRSLQKEDMKQIVSIMLNEVIQRAEEQLNIGLAVTAAARTMLVEESFDKKYGARPLRRKIQSSIEDRLAEEILNGTVSSGDKVSVTVSNKKLEFKVG